jgi:ubiquinone/menaquinone biosynthesis C-methylase UbiE
MEKSSNIYVCPVEIAGALDNSLRRLVQNPKKILKRFLQPGDRVLDLGCGPGFFTIDIAQLIGESGYVYAADIQDRMLDKVRKKITFMKMGDRIQVHKCMESAINLNDTVDFILAFYIIHELHNQENTFLEFKKILNPLGKVLIVEPNYHVTKHGFQDMILSLEDVGFKIIEKPKFLFSRSVLLQINN